MQESFADRIEAPEPVLFTVDLNTNGGIFAPKTVQEVQDWVSREMEFWNWTETSGFGNHKGTFDNAIRPLRDAVGQAQEAIQQRAAGNESAFLDRLVQVQNHIREAFLNRGLPHSSTPLGKRVSDLKGDPRAAMAYLFPFMPVMPGYEHQFDARDTSSWRGFVTALIDKFNIVSGVEPKIQAEREALEDLRAKSEAILGAQAAAADQVHRDFVSLASEIERAKKAQEDEFQALLLASDSAQKEALANHLADMESLRRTFRESMTLRGPVEYWKSKAKGHQEKGRRLMGWVFGSMGALTVIIGSIAYWVLFEVGEKAPPQPWKIAVLVLVGVIGVWAIRLIVRMFLSHSHLATDAEERVTMVQTYLALLEGEKMLSEEDRKLVLAPLFRPASDGMVKDEGMPHPMLELFTRTGPK